VCVRLVVVVISGKPGPGSYRWASYACRPDRSVKAIMSAEFCMCIQTTKILLYLWSRTLSGRGAGEGAVTLIDLNSSVACLPWLPLHIKAATTTTKRELLRVAAEPEAATSRMVRPFHDSAHALIMPLTSASLPLQGARDNQLTARNASLRLGAGHDMHDNRASRS
jgi:hypothetical protein